MPATAQVRIGADTKDFRRAMNGINAQFKKLNKEVGIVNKSVTLLGKSFSGLGKLGTFVGIPGIIGASANAFMKFEKNVSEVYTLLPKANRAAFEEMSKDALRFSEKFGIMPEEVTRGMYQAISAGIEPETLMQDDGFLDVAQKSAIAGVTDLKTAVDAFTNVINSYGKETYDVSQVADMMFRAVSMSKTTFRELADYMYQILPTAGSLGIRLDDLLGSISALAATGTLTRVGTTQLRQMFIELGRTGDKANEAFLQASGGTPFQQFIRDGGRVTEVIAMIGKVAKSRGTDLRNLFGSVEAGNAAINLFTSRSVQGMINELDEDSNASAGSMSDAFKKMSNTVSFQFSRMTRTFMNTFAKLGNVMKPVILDIISIFQGFADRISDLPWDDMRYMFAGVWSGIKNLIEEGKFWDTIIQGFSLALRGIALIAIKGARLLKDIFKTAFPEVFDFYGEAKSGLKKAWETFKELFESFSELGGGAFQSLIDSIASIGDQLSDALLSAIAVTKVEFNNLIDEVITRLKNLPVIGNLFSTEEFESRYGSRQEALEATTKEYGDQLEFPSFGKQVNEALSFGEAKFGAFDNRDDNVQAIERLRDLLPKSSYIKAVQQYRVLTEGKDMPEIPNIDYEKATGGEGLVDFAELKQLVENIKILNQSIDGLNPANFNLVFPDIKDNTPKIFDAVKDLENIYLQAASRAPMTEEQKQERTETYITRTIESVKNTSEQILPEFGTLGGSQLIEGAGEKFGEAVNKFTKLIDVLIDTDTKPVEINLKKQLDNLVKDFQKLMVFPEDKEQEPKYTDGGIPLTDAKEPWQLINRSASVVADSLQRIGGGGFFERTIKPEKLTEEEQKQKDFIELLKRKEAGGGVLTEKERNLLKGINAQEAKKEEKKEVKSQETNAIEAQTSTLSEKFNELKDALMGIFKDDPSPKIEKNEKFLNNESRMPTESNSTAFNFNKYNAVLDRHMALISRMEDLQERAERSEPTINFS